MSFVGNHPIQTGFVGFSGAVGAGALIYFLTGSENGNLIDNYKGPAVDEYIAGLEQDEKILAGVAIGLLVVAIAMTIAFVAYNKYQSNKKDDKTKLGDEEEKESLLNKEKETDTEHEYKPGEFEIVTRFDGEASLKITTNWDKSLRNLDQGKKFDYEFKKGDQILYSFEIIKMSDNKFKVQQSELTTQFAIVHPVKGEIEYTNIEDLISQINAEKGLTGSKVVVGNGVDSSKNEAKKEEPEKEENKQGLILGKFSKITKYIGKSSYDVKDLEKDFKTLQEGEETKYLLFNSADKVELYFRIIKRGDNEFSVQKMKVNGSQVEFDGDPVTYTNTNELIAQIKAEQGLTGSKPAESKEEEKKPEELAKATSNISKIETKDSSVNNQWKVHESIEIKTVLMNLNPAKYTSMFIKYKDDRNLSFAVTRNKNGSFTTTYGVGLESKEFTYDTVDSLAHDIEQGKLVGPSKGAIKTDLKNDKAAQKN